MAELYHVTRREQKNSRGPRLVEQNIGFTLDWKARPLYHRTSMATAGAICYDVSALNNEEVNMIPRIEIDEARKQRIIDKAGHFGAGEDIANYGA